MSTDKLCRDCKFWRSHANRYVPADDGQCDHPSPKWRAFTEACAADGIDTDPDFGCVQFEAQQGKAA